MEICAVMPEYTRKTGLLFMLGFLNNFAANGRVSPAVAKIAGVLGIRIVGKAGDVGTLEPTDKCRGEGKSLTTILKHLKEYGLKSGKVQIAHCRNETAAQTLKQMIAAELPNVTVKIGKNLGLCSYHPLDDYVDSRRNCRVLRCAAPMRFVQAELAQIAG